MLPMTHDTDSSGPGLEDIARHRLRSLRLARGWTLDELAARSSLSASTISRIETGHRRLALDNLVHLARALGSTVDELLAAGDDDVVIRPTRTALPHGGVYWPLVRAGDTSGRVVAKVRYPASRRRPEPQVHPGRDWCYVLSGTARLLLGEREYLLEAGQAAEFSTMTPHWIAGYGGPVELLMIFDHHGEHAHLHGPVTDR